MTDHKRIVEEMNKMIKVTNNNYFTQEGLQEAKKYWNILTSHGLITRMHKIEIINNKKAHIFLDKFYKYEKNEKTELIKHQSNFHINGNAMYVITGALHGGYIGIDIDVKGESGVNTNNIYNMNLFAANVINNTLTGTTPSGGYHYVYKLTIKQWKKLAFWKGSSQLKLFDCDIDVLYNLGKFVMYGSYKFNGEQKSYEIINTTKPMILPDIVFNEIIKRIPAHAITALDFWQNEKLDITNNIKCIHCKNIYHTSKGGMFDAWGIGRGKFVCGYCGIELNDNDDIKTEYSKMDFESKITIKTDSVAAELVLELEYDNKINEKNNNNNDEKIMEYLKCLKPIRCSDYGEWYRIGAIIYNSNGSFKLFNEWSKQCKEKYSKQACIDIWKSYNKKSQRKAGLTKLKKIAQEDNPELFSSIIGNTDTSIIYKDFINSAVCDDKAIGDLFYKIYPNDYIYDSENQTWYSINQYGIYVAEGVELLSARIKIRDELYENVAIHYNFIKKNTKDPIQIEIIMKFYLAFCKKIGSVSQRKLIVEDLKEKYKTIKFREKSNTNKYIFPFDNGVYDMKIFEFRNAYPEEIVTETCGYNYKSSTIENKKEVMKMIKNIFVDEELLAYVLKVFALRLVKVNMLEEFYFLIGPGGNGKGLLTRLIENTFGIFSQTLNPDTFMKNKHGVHAEAASPAIASTSNSTIVFVNELSQTMKIISDILKRISGNDKIKTRYLRENFFEFIPGYALFFVSNYDPSIDGADKGIQRRCRYIPFNVKFTDNPDKNNKYECKIDRSLKEKIKTDSYKCAFFDILVEYYKVFITNDINELKPPQCVLKKTNEYLNENDALKKFINDELIITNKDEDKISSSALYTMYLEYNDGNSRGYDKIKFKKRLIEDFNIRDKRLKAGIFYYGIREKNDNITEI